MADCSMCNAAILPSWWQSLLPSHNPYGPFHSFSSLERKREGKFPFPACSLHPHHSPLSQTSNTISSCSLCSSPGGRHCRAGQAGWSDGFADWLACVCTDWPNSSLAEHITPEFRLMLFFQRALIWFFLLHRSHCFYEKTQVSTLCVSFL